MTFPEQGAVREVLHDHSGHAGRFYSRLNNRSVEFESPTLERTFLRRLELCLDVASYQEQPFPLNYSYRQWNEDTPGQWTYVPDLLVRLQDGRRFVVEIKPRGRMALWSNVEKLIALRSICEFGGIGYLVTDGSYTPADLANRPVEPAFEAELVAMVEASPAGLTWKEVQPLRASHHAANLDFCAVVLRRDLKWYLNPFWVGARHHPARRWGRGQGG